MSENPNSSTRGRPKGSKNKNGYTHSLSSLAQRNKNQVLNFGNNHTRKDFFTVPVDSKGAPLVDDDTLKELYTGHYIDFASNPMNSLIKLGSKVSTLLDIQQKVDATEGKIMSKDLLRGVKLLNEMTKNLHQMGFGTLHTVVDDRKSDKFWEDGVIDVTPNIKDSDDYEKDPEVNSEWNLKLTG